MLEIKNLHASIAGKEILKGIDLTVNDGEIHAICSPSNPTSAPARVSSSASSILLRFRESA